MGRLEQGQAPTPAGERGKGCPAVSEEAQLARIEGGDRPRPSHQPAAREGSSRGWQKADVLEKCNRRVPHFFRRTTISALGEDRCAAEKMLVST